jgi:hypothetical protein
VIDVYGDAMSRRRMFRKTVIALHVVLSASSRSAGWGREEQFAEHVQIMQLPLSKLQEQHRVAADASWSRHFQCMCRGMHLVYLLISSVGTEHGNRSQDSASM